MKNNRLENGNVAYMNCNNDENSKVNVDCYKTLKQYKRMAKKVVEDGFNCGFSYTESDDNYDTVCIVAVCINDEEVKYIAWDIDNNIDRIRNMIDEYQGQILRRECVSLNFEQVNSIE